MRRSRITSWFAPRARAPRARRCRRVQVVRIPPDNLRLVRGPRGPPLEPSADIIRRYSQRRSGPLLNGTTSRVHYLDYKAIQDHGWSLDDEALFEEASAADLSPSQYGRFLVQAGGTILEAAENRGIEWPYACRGGACANCAVIVKEGDVAMPGQTILNEDQVQRMNARLTCVGVPVSEELKLVMNVQRLEGLRDLRLPSPMPDAEPAL